MRRHRPRALVAGVAVGACVVALAACDVGGSEDPGKGAGEAPAARVSVEEDPDRDGPAPDVAGARDGGTITVYLPADPGPDTLDPSGISSTSGRSLLQALTHRSLTQHVRGEDGQPTLVPDLATDLGRPNRDFTRWTFTIRRGATWEDGRPVTPEEVAFGICRSLDTGAFPSSTAAEYSKAYFTGARDYRGPYTGDDPRCEKWKGVEVSGRDVTITTSRPFPDLDHWAASVAMGPAPLGRAAEPPGYGRQPLATGPYRVESFEPGKELVLERNDQWRPASDPARHQYVDEWVFRFDQDQDEVDEVMLSDGPEGQTSVSTAIGPNRYESAASELGERLVRQPTSCVSTLAPDYTRITDVRVRRALAYAYPYQEVWYAAGEVPNVTRTPAPGLLAPTLGGGAESSADGEQISFNPARAKELLAEAGHGERPYPITMAYYGRDPVSRDVQEVITKGLAESGFRVRAIRLRQSPYRVWLDPDNKVDKSLNLRGINWCPPWPTGAAVIPPLLASDGDYNTARFSEEEVDAEVERIATMPAAEQAAAWAALDERIMREWFPVIPTSYSANLLVFGEQVGNPSGDGWLGTPNYRDLYVAQ